MDFYTKSIDETVAFFNSDKQKGLQAEQVVKLRKLYGANVFEKKKRKGFFSRVFDSLKEPMMIILFVSFLITFISGIGKVITTGEVDFIESIGILFAISLSVIITLFMERSSEKAFLTLNKIYDNVHVVVRRGGQEVVVKKENVVVGDIILLKTGDKVIADGRLIKTENLEIDESALTGESKPVSKIADKILKKGTYLADRINSVYSGTFVKNGNGEMIVTNVGESGELGQIAKELKKERKEDSPLTQKLNKLSKRITIVGAIFSIVIFIINFIRLITTNGLNYENIQSIFVSSIVLIVAAVPEGLPTIVAVSLALNMIKLAKENALIKKLTAIETTGAINVICSDKTGTLTENKMSLEQIFFINKKEHCKKAIWHNVVINSTAEKIVKKGKIQFVGSGTECALLQGFVNAKQGDYKELRDEYKVVKRLPFSSTIKKMATLVEYENSYRIYLKGAPEVLLNLTTLTDFEKKEILYKIEDFESKGKRIICFLHKDVQTVNIDENGYVYDGFCVLDDKIRKDVFDAIKTCKEAGIKIIMLTGDNLLTATNIAKELKITRGNDLLLTGKEIDEMSDAELKKCLPKISLVARSTPSTKLRVVKILRELNNVVAVTGDGINDAPAIKEADVGIAMATGTEITKEASDVVLLDDSFATIVKAVSFGRNVYQNLQRFILFQLSVNMSAVLFITLSLLITGIAPFNTLQLLWINIIMDGPPALTLGLEATNVSLMKNKPIKKNSSICSKKMFLRILINGVFIAIALLLQQIFNFLNVEEKEFASVIFTAFILFQLFNAFNSRELGTVSIFKSIKKNKIMLTVFGITFLIHVFIVEFLYKPFNIVPLSFLTWVKVLLFTFLIVVISEIYKLLYKLTVKKINKSRKISIN